MAARLRARSRRAADRIKRQPLCVECLKLGIVTPATVADHVTPHRGDFTAFMTGKLLHGPTAERQAFDSICRDAADRLRLPNARL